MAVLLLAILQLATLATLQSATMVTEGCPLPRENCTLVNYLSSGTTEFNINIDVHSGQAPQFINGPSTFSRNTGLEYRPDMCTNCSALAPCYDSFHSSEARSTQTCVEGLGIALPNNRAGRLIPSCPWRYTCDYEENRIPQYLWRAECESSARNATLAYYSVPILKPKYDVSESNPFTDINTWKWEMQKVPVACVCQELN